MSDENATAKENLRTEHRRRRSTRSAEALAAAGAGLALHGLDWADAVLGGRRETVCAYLSVGTEPPTLPLIQALHAAGHRVLLPVCEAERELSWVDWRPGVQFERSKFAPLLEPTGPRHPTTVAGQAALLFLPATAVDRDGNRLGQGGGYYDVFQCHLAAADRHIPRTAVVFDDEILPAGSIPAEPFDRPVPAVLTPSGFQRLSRQD